MTEQKGGSSVNRWSWDVTGFEPPKKSSEAEDYHQRQLPLARRYSISTSLVSPHSELSRHSFNSKLVKMTDKVKVAEVF